MTRFLLLLFSVLALTVVTSNAQIRRGTGLQAHNHGPVLFYARTIKLTIKPGCREQFLQATSSLQAKIAREAGCREYHYYEDPATPDSFLLLSEWTTAAAMQAYCRQQYAIEYFEQLAHWLVEPAQVHILETVNHQAANIQSKP